MASKYTTTSLVLYYSFSFKFATPGPRRPPGFFRASGVPFLVSGDLVVVLSFTQLRTPLP